MKYLLDFRRTERVVEAADLVATYEALTGNDDGVVTWNDGGMDGVLIVSVHDGFATVSMLDDATWYWLVESPDTDLVEITLAELPAQVPGGALVARATALAVLLIAPDFARLRREFTWLEQ